MAFKALGQHIKNLAIPHVSEIVNNFVSAGSQKDSGKVAAKLMKKSNMDIPDSPSQAQVSNPLQFSPVQYPLDLGSAELGHYILFESGFVGYSPQTSQFRTKRVSKGKDRFGHEQFGYEPFEKARAEMRKNKVITFTDIGYDELFITTKTNMKVDDTEAQISSDMTASKMKQAWAKNFKSKKMSRVLLNKFIERVA